MRRDEHDAGGAVDHAGRLTVQVQGGDGEPERVLRVSRPHEGTVQVWEWASGGDAPQEYEAPAGELYASIARAAARGRRVSEELYRLRLWLLGAGA